MAKARLRPFRLADAQGVPAPAPEAPWTQFQRPPGFVYTLVRGDVIRAIGGAAEIDHGLWQLWSLKNDLSQGDYGFALKAVAALIASLWDLTDAKRLELYVKFGDLKAVGFAERLGFRLIEKRGDFYLMRQSRKAS